MIQQEDIDCYSKLFVAIIVQAVMDAGTKPNEDEKREELNLMPEATSAMEYLFGCDRHVFAHHASLIGADAEQIRESLLNRDQPVTMQHMMVTPDKLRTLRIRYRWHKNRSLEHV
jgi:hypothetical protein